MMQVQNYHVSYGQSQILHGLEFEVNPGEIVALVGRNGMGKTTLMKSLMGIVPAREGKMFLNNEDMAGLLSHERVSRGVAYVPQGRMIFATMTVEENIETGLAASSKKTISEEIYDLFPVLKEMRTRRGGNLSGGQQQQLAIARALVSEPKVLLLDEPTEGIQPSIIKELAQVLKRIRDERGLSILVSEQVLSFVMDASDRIMVIENGRIVHEDNRDDVDQDTIVRYLSV
ncbi:MAG: urea ABC transporter ATP-binding subunit UrtE [Rhodospirillaceae bacterium]|jgi:urea transport system ATP-binding protein|nr:urea ABC transporter ATP-binding subunit UrtE [Rhodospirillaceae bacterium]MBT7447772.1 urea ABC transporter ATP-binding subunit UrtE [Tateyamaria sp.]MDC0541429.1 urea ABC transporter ATP-binding subunit UrtE [Paracoccaceae bacterium]